MNESRNTLKLELHDNRTTLSSGSTIAGTLRWFGLSEKSSKVINLRLGWTASNKDQQDIMCHSTEQIQIKGSSGKAEFSTQLPSGPYTWKGELFSIQWMLEAQSSDGKYLIQLPFSVKAMS